MRFVRRKGLEALKINAHQVAERVSTAYDIVKRFCEGLGGRFYPEEREEKVLLAMCYVDRKFSRDEIVDIVGELRVGRVHNALEKLLDKLGDFEIVEETEEYPRSRIKYENFSGIVRVSSEDLLTFDIPSHLVAYTYPDSVEDYLSGRDVWFNIRAKGARVKPGKPLTAFSWGTLHFSPDVSLSREEIKKHVNEFLDALRDILKNPRNFFSFKGSK